MEQPPPQGPRWPGDWGPGPMGHWHRGPFWRRHQGTGGPLRRDPADRLLGGVAAGVAAWRGFNPTVVRIVFVLIALVTTGFGVAFYVAAWLLIPAAGADRSIGSKARSDARGIALAIGLGTLLTLFLLVGGVFNDSWFASWAWPQVASLAGLVLIWRNGSADEQASLRHYAEPLGAAVGETSRNRRSAIRLTIASVLILSGAVSLAKTHASLALLAPFGGVAAVIAGIVLFLGPWWLRIARDLGLERQARVRAEERADLAARVHDSVLQTLALI
ncbi:MAG TPA: PspC domain-containing protein, partial [Streptosporangiaceae bacterium]